MGTGQQGRAYQEEERGATLKPHEPFWDSQAVGSLEQTASQGRLLQVKSEISGVDATWKSILEGSKSSIRIRGSRRHALQPLKVLLSSTD